MNKHSEIDVNMRHYRYPYVGRSNHEGYELKVLFVRPDTGVVIFPEKYVGDISTNWAEERFERLRHDIGARELAYILEVANND